MNAQELTKKLKGLDDKYLPVYVLSHGETHPVTGVTLHQDPLGFERVIIHTKIKK